MINDFNGIPLYANNCNEPESFMKIQQEFRAIYEDLTNKGKFKKRDEWDSSTHKLSDPHFNENLLDQYDTTEFKKFLTACVGDYLLDIGYPLNVEAGPEGLKYTVANSWMTLTQKGEYAHMHAHGGSDISGVYYYQTTGTDGSIYFQSPNKLMHCSEVFRFYGEGDRINAPPRIGTILLFPSFMDHGVMTNTEDSDRVSISFNILIDRESRRSFNNGNN